MSNDNLNLKIFWITIFGIAMGFAEAAVVVYLRAIYYPEGFSFPLKILTDYKIMIEVLREIATLFMLLSVAFFAGRKFWERFAYFILPFGIWDIFYYIWLKVLIDWPSSMFDWDILFLIYIFTSALIKLSRSPSSTFSTSERSTLVRKSLIILYG